MALYQLCGILYKPKLSGLLCFSLLMDFSSHLTGVHLLSQCAGLVCAALLCCPETCSTFVAWDVLTARHIIKYHGTVCVCVCGVPGLGA